MNVLGQKNKRTGRGVRDLDIEKAKRVKDLSVMKEFCNKGYCMAGRSIPARKVGEFSKTKRIRWPIVGQPCPYNSCL